MKKSFFIFTLTLLHLVLTPIGFANNLLDDQFVEEALKTFRVPGAAVGVVIDGKVVFSKGYGYRDYPRQLEVTENTIFAIGSCTKAFTSFILGQLVEEGALAWDDPVGKHLPQFLLKDPYIASHLTIRDVVSHRSGLANHDFLCLAPKICRKDLIDRIKQLDFSHELRQKFQYNNVMYVVAGLIIEKITGNSWEEAVKSRILDPLGMHASNFSIEEMQKSADFALPYILASHKIKEVPFRDITAFGPTGSINSSLSDMLKWIQFLSMQEDFEKKHLIRKETLEQLYTLQIVEAPFPTSPIYPLGYGLGWRIGMYRGNYHVFHGGIIDGFISYVSLLPNKQIGVVVLTNSGDGGSGFVHCVTNTIMDSLLEVEKVDWIAKIQANQKKAGSAFQRTNSSVVRPLGDYIGIYEHAGYGNVEVSLKADTLIITYGQLSIGLKPEQADVFRGFLLEPVFHGVAPLCSFLLHENEIDKLHIVLDSASLPIVFKKVR